MSVQVRQFVWPAFQAFSDVVPERRQASPRYRRSRTLAPVGQEISGSAFARGLSLAIERAVELRGPWLARLTATVELSGEPPERHEALLLQLACALVEDAVVHSLEATATGAVAVRGGRIGAQFRLIVEDDGWRPRSATAWLADNVLARAAAANAGGHLRREVDWAVNRTIVALPV